MMDALKELRNQKCKECNRAKFHEKLERQAAPGNQMEPGVPTGNWPTLR